MFPRYVRASGLAPRNLRASHGRDGALCILARPRGQRGVNASLHTKLNPGKRAACVHSLPLAWPVSRAAGGGLFSASTDTLFTSYRISVLYIANVNAIFFFPQAIMMSSNPLLAYTY